MEVAAAAGEPAADSRVCRIQEGFTVKRSILVLIIVLLVVGAVFGSSYNRLVGLEVDVDTQWAQVETQLQRRWDLIPNLVSTARAYMEHEQEVFSNIADARARLAGASATPDKVEAANQLEASLARLLVVVENYPTLKANENFRQLSDQLEGTENRIAVERRRYNEAVADWNRSIRRFPSVFIAGIFGMEGRAFFEMVPEAAGVPEVSF